MKKLLIIFIILYALGSFLKILIVEDEVEAKPIEEIKMTVSGNSMIDYGFRDGDVIEVKIQNRCKVEDVCVFICNSDKCGKHKSERVFKSLRYIDDHGYYFEGTIDDFPCGYSEDICYSNDSREWGQLRKDEIEIVGVVE